MGLAGAVSCLASSSLGQDETHVVRRDGSVRSLPGKLWAQSAGCTHCPSVKGMSVTQTATLGWVILYVPDVEMALGFYERAFGFKRGFVDENASFGQLQTGETALSFATEERARQELRGPFRRASLDEDPFNVELCLVFDDPYEAFRHAITVGCTAVAEPEPKPHGQVAGFVRDAFGNLVEIASPLRPR